MPVVFWPMESALHRGSMEGKAIGWIRKKFKETMEQRLDPNGKIYHLLFGNAMKIRAVNLRNDPGFKGIA